MRAIVLCLGLISACGSKIEETECGILCDTLVNDCEVAAFPSTEECESACAFGEEQGADILAYRLCVDSVSECDTFGIVECENEHGW